MKQTINFYVIIFDVSGLYDIMLFHTEIILITQKLYILAESFAKVRFLKMLKKKPLNLHGYESSISTKCERLTVNCCMALSEGYCLKINPNCKKRELHYPNEFLQ